MLTKSKYFVFTCVPNHSAHFVASLEWQLSTTESRSCRNYSTSFRQPFYPLQAANLISLKPTFSNMHQRFVSDPACDHQVDRQSHTCAQQHVLPTCIQHKIMSISILIWLSWMALWKSHSVCIGNIYIYIRLLVCILRCHRWRFKHSLHTAREKDG